MFACLYVPGNVPLGIECARMFSPHIEEHPPDSVLFDARGLESLYGPAEKLAAEIERRIGIPASIALASNPDAAMHAARGIQGITVIPPGKEADVLAPLPLNLLETSFLRDPAETAELLDLWGIRTFGELAALPPLGVAARLGDEGVQLQRLAAGNTARQLKPITDPLKFECEMELDYPVELLEALSFILARLLNELCGRLAERALATNELRLQLTLDKRTGPEFASRHVTTLRLPVPMLDAKVFLKMLLLELNGRPPGAAVVKVHLNAEPVEPRRTQHGLFLPASPEPGKLELTITRLRHLVGENHVGSPEIQDTHRPDSFVMRAFAPETSRTAIAVKEPTVFEEAPHEASTPRLCLRRFRPPRFAQVLVVNHQPVRVSSPSISGRVVMARGPWRTSGNWWRADLFDGAWNCDEWDIALESGALYRVAQEIATGRWFIEGNYD